MKTAQKVGLAEEKIPASPTGTRTQHLSMTSPASPPLSQPRSAISDQCESWTSAVARKRSRSFCQKCRWQVTVKHAYTLRMWLCMKWHGAWLDGAPRTCAEMAAVSCGTSHASAVSTPLPPVDIQKTRYKKMVTHVEPHASAVSLLKKAENSAICLYHQSIKPMVRSLMG